MRWKCNGRAPQSLQSNPGFGHQYRFTYIELVQDHRTIWTRNAVSYADDLRELSDGEPASNVIYSWSDDIFISTCIRFKYGPVAAVSSRSRIIINSSQPRYFSAPLQNQMLKEMTRVRRRGYLTRSQTLLNDGRNDMSLWAFDLQVESMRCLQCHRCKIRCLYTPRITQVHDAEFTRAQEGRQASLRYRRPCGEKSQ